MRGHGRGALRGLLMALIVRFVKSLRDIGVNVTNEELKELLSVDANGWKEAVPQIREHYAAFGERLPTKLLSSLDDLESALT